MNEIDLAEAVDGMWTQTWSKFPELWRCRPLGDIARLVCTQYVDETKFTEREADLVAAELHRRLPGIRYFEVGRRPPGSPRLRMVDLALIDPPFDPFDL